jgi:nitronate monooxygenase
MQTSVTRLLGIELPIIQAPIGGLSVPALAGAVAKAGGLGMMAQTWMTPEEIRASIAEIRAITDHPFGINLVIRQPQHERLAVALAEGVKVVSLFWG